MSDRKAVQVANASVVSRYWPPAVLGALGTAAMTFAINFLTDGKPGWWWIVLVLGGLVLAGAGVWAYAIQQQGGGDGPPSRSESVQQQDAGVTQQSATGNGTNFSINANNGGVAAYEIDTVNIQGRPSNPTPETG